MALLLNRQGCQLQPRPRSSHRPRIVLQATKTTSTATSSPIAYDFLKPVTSAGQVRSAATSTSSCCCSRAGQTPVKQRALRYADSDPHVTNYLTGYYLLVQIKELKEGIAAFYDESSGLWENMWGEHMHHGGYCTASPAALHC